MCDPVSLSIAGLALAGTTSTIGYIQQHRAATKAADENAAFFDANKKAAIDAEVLQSREIGLRQSEELLASATAQQDINLSEEAALSTARVSAAEAGITGHSVDAVLNDIATQGSKERQRMQTNSELQQQQLQREKEGVLAQAQGNINTVRQADIRQPSILTPILATSGAALNSLDYLAQRRLRRPTTPAPSPADRVFNLPGSFATGDVIPTDYSSPGGVNA